MLCSYSAFSLYRFSNDLSRLCFHSWYSVSAGQDISSFSSCSSVLSHLSGFKGGILYLLVNTLSVFDKITSSPLECLNLLPMLIKTVLYKLRPWLLWSAISWEFHLPTSKSHNSGMLVPSQSALIPLRWCSKCISMMFIRYLIDACLYKVSIISSVLLLKAPWMSKKVAKCIRWTPLMSQWFLQLTIPSPVFWIRLDLSVYAASSLLWDWILLYTLLPLFIWYLL